MNFNLFKGIGKRILKNVIYESLSFCFSVSENLHIHVILYDFLDHASIIDSWQFRSPFVTVLLSSLYLTGSLFIILLSVRSLLKCKLNLVFLFLVNTLLDISFSSVFLKFLGSSHLLKHYQKKLSYEFGVYLNYRSYNAMITAGIRTIQSRYICAHSERIVYFVFNGIIRTSPRP